MPCRILGSKLGDIRVCLKNLYVIFYIILIHGYIVVFFDFPFYINKNNTIVYIRHNIS